MSGDRSVRDLILAAVAIVLLFVVGGAVGWIIRPMEGPMPCPDEYWPHRVNSNLDVTVPCDEVLRDIVKRGLDAIVAALKLDNAADVSDMRKAIQLAQQCSDRDDLNHDAAMRKKHVDAVDTAWGFAKNNKWQDCWQSLVQDAVNHPH